MAACRFCNEAHNRTIWDVEGKTPDQLVAQKKPYVLAKRDEYRRFWEQEVWGSSQVDELHTKEDA